MKLLKPCLASVFLALNACGGGGSNAPTTSVAAPPPPPPPAPPPTAERMDDCQGLDFLSILSASDDGSSDTGLIPANVIDDNLDATSRWSSQDIGASLTLDLGGPRLLREIGIAFFEGDQRTASFTVSASEDGEEFQDLLPVTQSSGQTLVFERFAVSETPANFLRITSEGNNLNNEIGITEIAAFGCSLDLEAAPPLTVEPFDPAIFSLSPTQTPGENFDLLTWSLDTPADLDGNQRADRIPERSLDSGFENEFFFTGEDGGMVFFSTIDGAPTSLNTRFNRSELREQLRRGDTSISTTGVTENNWALGYQPETSQPIGGRNGVLKGTLVINNVTSTGERNQVGRTIIGQIHADNDEPMRIYYRKFPENERGFIYFAHEIRDSDDIWLVVVGPENDDIDDEPNDSRNPENGIALGELFSYEIIQDGSRIDVIIRRGDEDGEIIGHNYVDMIERNSGYDRADEWMYFRAGAYTQNNSGDLTDFDRATFYRVENTHD